MRCTGFMGRSNVTVHCQPPRASCRRSRLALLALVAMHVSSQHTWWDARVSLQPQRSFLGCCVCLLPACALNTRAAVTAFCASAGKQLVGSLLTTHLCTCPFFLPGWFPGHSPLNQALRAPGWACRETLSSSLRVSTYTLSISLTKDRFFKNLMVVF